MSTTLVVFRNAVSHTRYNESRSHLSVLKNALRTTLALVLSGGIAAESGERAATFRNEAKEIALLLQVGFSSTAVDPLSPPSRIDHRSITAPSQAMFAAMKEDIRDSRALNPALSVSWWRRWICRVKPLPDNALPVSAASMLAAQGAQVRPLTADTATYATA